MRPIIGITCGTSDLNTNDSYIGNEYISAIESAGGTPIVLPLAQDESSFDGYIGIMDGLLLSGGVDMDPSYYGEEPIQALGRIDVERDQIEIYLAIKALSMGMPIFGICRGIQTLNVTGKGTLYQDMYSDLNGLLKHRQTAPGSHATHSIDIKEGSRLARIIGQTSFRVNTFHHQSVKGLAPGFVISATASDGIIECIESTKHPFAIGVQFHPERMWKNSEPMLTLFKAFVDAGVEYKKQKSL